MDMSRHVQKLITTGEKMVMEKEKNSPTTYFKISNSTV